MFAAFNADSNETKLSPPPSYQLFLYYKNKFDAEYEIFFRYRLRITCLEDGSLSINNLSHVKNEKVFAAIMSFITRAFEIKWGSDCAKEFYGLTSFAIKNVEEFCPRSLLVRPEHAKQVIEILKIAFSDIQLDDPLTPAQDQQKSSPKMKSSLKKSYIGKFFKKKPHTTQKKQEQNTKGLRVSKKQS